MSDGKYELGRDKNSTPTGIEMAEPLSCFATTLFSGVEQTFAVPSAGNLAVLTYGELNRKDVYATLDAAPLALPTGSFQPYKGKHTPAGFAVSFGQTLRFISNGTVFVTIEFYNSNPANG